MVKMITVRFAQGTIIVLVTQPNRFNVHKDFLHTMVKLDVWRWWRKKSILELKESYLVALTWEDTIVLVVQPSQNVQVDTIAQEIQHLLTALKEIDVHYQILLKVVQQVTILLLLIIIVTYALQVRVVQEGF
jgi:hypothetical protein